MTDLIEPQTLANRLDDPGLCILDCRSDLLDATAGKTAYDQGHIPGAQFADLESDLSAPVKPGVTGRHPLPEPTVWQATLQRWGIGENTPVVVYDSNNSMFAARAWWMLRWAGLSEVQVLNGGWQAWQGQELSTTTVVPAPAIGDIQVRCAKDALVTADQLMQDLPSYTLLDARAPARYRGETEPLDAKAGHIPGAVCLDFTQNLLPDGRFKPADELRERFLATGLAPAMQSASPTCYAPEPVAVSYCGSGVTACHNILAATLAGLPEPRLYAGSWSEWITDDKRPVAVGE